MVFKMSKGGVRSGNTLRGLQSKRSKLYGRHACLIGSSNLGCRDLQSLLRKSSEENKLVGDTVKRTNVLLSLNKKQRWRVPALVNQMISHGGFDQTTMVSLLERHKLKRKANCVRFACNKGRSTNIQPKQRKYFSFSLDSVGDDHSNREKRRIKTDGLKKQRTQEGGILAGQETFRKNIDAMTHAGRIPLNFSVRGSNKPEYRFEVFYPCPQSCSLTFNLKYTDVKLGESKSGGLEVKTNVKASRNGQRRHRRRFTSKDLDAFRDENIDQDINEMWADIFDTETDTEAIVENEDDTKTKDNTFQDSFLATLIGQAEKSQKLLDPGKRQRKKKIVDQTISEAKRSHIVYIERETEDTGSQNSVHIDHAKPLDFVRVILKSSETTTESLQQKYGTLYSEATAQPRRFIIDVSDDVANLLSPTKLSAKSLLFVSYLVFIHDGMSDDGLEVFRVIFNTCLCKNRTNLSEYIGFSQTSLDQILNSVIEFLLDSQDKKELKSDDFYRFIDANRMRSFLYNRINLKVKTFKPSKALSDKTICGLFQEGSATAHTDDRVNFVPRNDDLDTFCDICYDVINSTKRDAVTGTQLSRCGHLCCDCCWHSHALSQILDGVTTVTCPGYNCRTELGLFTLLSIVDVSYIALLFQHKAEREFEEAENTKWCPNAACNRVIQIYSDTKDLCQDVMCPCGTEMCFACLRSPHWPAKCDQAEEYLEKLNNTSKPPKDSNEKGVFKPTIPQDSKPPKSGTYEEEGRICPRCRQFIVKNGGCNNVMCRCGHRLCWVCMKYFEGYGNTHSCKVDKDFILKHTRLLRVCHRRRQETISDGSSGPNSKPKIEKEKSALYQLAFQHRLEISKMSRSTFRKLTNDLVVNILAAVHRDVQLKEKILMTVEVQAVPEDTDELKTLNVRPSVVQLITSFEEMKAVLHHIAQFSYVLLQDSPDSSEKHHILSLINDITGICTFISSVFELRDKQNAETAFHRLLSLREWAKRALDTLIAVKRRLRQDEIAVV